ncbi:facilitated trehalose transporter Tret1-like [Achroia grisella]|uniref:facilitated trehalose transporter Tret1-like n=1 Tax=Achroia grisella TaxID=688607 RepID=UPI0027D2B29F|nr:facilitated trehalose transporter Tret1-like [Achroia grisella]
MDSEKLKSSAFAIQCWGTFCISFLACQTGYVFAWPSYTTDFFRSNETVLSKPMSTWEISLLGSLPNIGGLIATPFCGYAFNVLGRKYATILFGLPYVMAWAIISLTTNVTLILIAMTVAGIGIGGQNVSLIYISEISHASIRGGMTACSSSGFFLGLLISYVLGGYLTYYQVVYAHLTLSVAGMLLLMFLKESPVHLVRVGKEEEAAKSIAFYNQVDIYSKEVEIELRKIRLQLDPRLEKILAEQQDPEVTSELLNEKLGKDLEINKESPWKILRSSKSSKRALVTVLVVMTLTLLMGCIVLQVYAEPLFKDAVPSMPPNMCSIFLAIDFFIASFGCVLVVDRFGRKKLFVITSLACGICTLLLGSQLQLHWAPHWFTAFLIYAFSFTFSLGCGMIPFVLMAEVFLPEVRDICSSIGLSIMWMGNFVTLLVFNPLVEQLGLGPVFYIFSAICFFTSVYGQFRLPETKGLSVDAIQVLFLKKKK